MGLALGLIRLPFDALFLSLDLSRLILWSMWTGVLKLSGRQAMSWGPFCAGEESVGSQTEVCPAARKYGSLWVFRSLCPSAGSSVTGERVCGYVGDYARDTYVPYWHRVVPLGLGLLAVWASLGVGGVVAWSRRPPGEYPSEPVRAVVAAAPPGGQDQSIAADKTSDGDPHTQGKAETLTASPPQRDDNGAVREVAEANTHRPDDRVEEFVKSGDRYFAEGRYLEALIEYKNAVQRDGSNARARLGLGLCYLRGRGRVREARQALEEAVRLDPTLAEAHAHLCRAELARGNATRAAEHAQELKELGPGDPEGYVLLSACLEAGGDWDAAQREMEAATALEAATASTLSSAGSLYWRREDLDGAEVAYRRALELDEARVDVRVALAGVLRLKRDLAGAKQQIDAVRRDDPGNVGGSVELAEWLAAKGQVREAITTYEELIKGKPKLYDARARLAWLLARTGKTNDGVAVADALVKEKRGHVLGHLVLAETFHVRGFHDLAIGHCEQALATDRGHVHARVLLARCRLAKKQYDQGVRELERALRASPKHAKAQMLLAEAYVRLEQYDQAKERYEKVARDYPEVASPYLGLARIHLDRDLPEAAARCYEEALRRSPKNPVAANNLAMTLVELGRDLDRAHQLAADVKERFPQSPVFADTYGWVCYHRGDYQKAVGALSFAAKRQAKSPDMRYHYGMALCKTGDVRKAKEELKAALKLSVDFEGAGEAKAVLTDLSAARETGGARGAGEARRRARQN